MELQDLLEQTEQVDHQELLVLQDLVELQDLLEQTEHQDLQEHRDLQEPLERQDLREQTEHQDLQEHQEPVAQAQQGLQPQRLILIILVLVIMVPLKMLRFQEPILFLIQISQVQVLDITQVRVFLR